MERYTLYHLCKTQPALWGLKPATAFSSLFPSRWLLMMPHCPNRTLFEKIKLQTTVLFPSGISWESIYLNNRLLNYSPSEGIVPSHNNRELNWASLRPIYSSGLLPTHQPAVSITPELFYQELCPVYSGSNTERPAPKALETFCFWPPPPPAEFHSHAHKIKSNFLISDSQVIAFPNYSLHVLLCCFLKFTWIKIQTTILHCRQLSCL